MHSEGNKKKQTKDRPELLPNATSHGDGHGLAALLSEKAGPQPSEGGMGRGGQKKQEP